MWDKRYAGTTPTLLSVYQAMYKLDYMFHHYKMAVDSNYIALSSLIYYFHEFAFIYIYILLFPELNNIIYGTMLKSS